MEKVIEIINQIANTSSKKEKENILRQNQDNELLQKVLEYTYNPFKKYKMTEKAINPNIDIDVMSTYGDVFSMLDVLSKSNINNALRDNVNVFLYKTGLSEDRIDLFTKMLLKDLKMGCNVSTINKVWKGLIPKFSVMLAEKYYDYVEYLKGKRFTITIKEDGHRIAIVKDGDNIKCFTRQGKEYDGLNEIVEVIKQIPIDKIVLDGELMILNHKEVPSDQRYKMISKIVRKDGDKQGVKMILFDAIDLDGFKQGKDTTPYEKRRLTVESIAEYANSKFLEPVKVLYRGTDTSVIENILEIVVQAGEEGLMINIDESPYECKRTKNILKVKEFSTADLRVTNIFEGDGNFANMLGAIEVEFIHNGELHRCNCGTGFSQDERIYYYNVPEAILDKIVEVKYFEISTNDAGGYGLRFPVFLRVRDDKNEISMY